MITAVLKFVAGLYTAIALTCAFAAIVPAQSGQAEGVQLVKGRNGVGPSQQIPVGSFQVDAKQLSQGEGKEPEVSVRVSKDYFVRFCTGKDGSGKCEEYGEGTHNLVSADFNSIRVWKAAPAAEQAPVTTTPASRKVSPVTVFEQLHWQGRSQTYIPGMYRSSRGEFGMINDNMAMSVVIAKGFRARFCSDEGQSFRGAGDCEIHEEGRFNLRFANSISFIEVTDLSDNSPRDEDMPVVLYEDTSQRGRMQGFDVGAFLASQGHFRKLQNDQVLSIAVREGYRALVCADEPVSGGEPGGCEEITAGRRNLKNKRSASYLKVWKETK